MNWFLLFFLYCYCFSFCLFGPVAFRLFRIFRFSNEMLVHENLALIKSWLQWVVRHLRDVHGSFTLFLKRLCRCRKTQPSLPFRGDCKRWYLLQALIGIVPWIVNVILVNYCTVAKRSQSLEPTTSKAGQYSVKIFTLRTFAILLRAFCFKNYADRTALRRCARGLKWEVLQDLWSKH